MLEVEPAASPDAAAWDAFVAADATASGYHAWVWRDIFTRAFGHETRYLIARRDGMVAGVLPLVVFRSWLFGRFVVSLPFVNYGGVLAADGVTRRALLDASRACARETGARYVELRHTARTFADLPARTHKVAMTMPVPVSRASAWDGLDRKIRNQVRKAEKSGLTVESNSLDRLDAFYEVFSRNMRDLGTPVYSRRFFDVVLSRLGDAASCVVVRSGRRPVAAAITLRWRNTIEIPWASSLKAFRSECANTLLYWTLLAHAVEAGASVLDFGRSSPDSGTYHFKQQWGAAAAPVAWEYALADGQTLPELSPTNPKFHAMIATWKRLPLPLATAIGPHIVRSIP